MGWRIVLVLAVCGVMALAFLLGLIIGNIIRFIQGRPLCWLRPVRWRPCYHHHWWHHHHHKRKPRRLTLCIGKD